MDVASLPFNQLLGLESGETEGRAFVLLDPRPQHCNHVGTVHAAVLYGIAEAASGQCLLSHFPDLTGSAVALLRSSTVKYRNPASADVSLIAIGNLDDAAADRCRSQLAARGRGLVDITVSVRQADVELLTGTFRWFANRPAQP